MIGYSEKRKTQIESRYFIIDGAYFSPSNKSKPTKCFPSLNNLLSQAEKSPFAYNRDKKRYMTIASCAIRRYLKGWSPSGRVRLHFEFGEPKDGHYRDYDNIASAGHKIINDALVQTKTLFDDRPQYLAPSVDTFVYTDGRPYIKVTIEELER